MIVAEDVTQQANDKQQLHPMLEQAKANRQTVGVKEIMNTALADAGYGSDDNFRKVPAGGAELLIATQKDWKQRKARRAERSSRCSGRLRMFEVSTASCDVDLKPVAASGR